MFRGLSPFFTVPHGNAAVLRDAAAEIRPPLRVKILVFAGRIWYNGEKDSVRRICAMEKNDVNRILHTMTPFVLMVLTERLLILLFGRLFPGIGETGKLCAYLPAAALALFLFRWGRFAEEEEYDPVPPMIKKSVPRCLLHLALSAAALVTVMFMVSAYMNGDTAFPDTARAAGDMPSLTPLSVLSLLVIHPLTEEYLFRGCFYGELRRMNPVFGCMAQAVMFAILHSSVDEMLYALAAGVILGILAEETGRLWPCAAAHIFVNARSLVAVTVLAELGGVRYAMDSTLLTVGAAAFVILAATRARFAADPESPADPSRKAADAGKQEARA